MNENQEHPDCRATELDYLLADPHMQMLKAALPYMPYSRQRFCSMLIQIQQIQRTRSLFQDGQMSAMELSRSGNKEASPIEMLQAIKPYASQREREIIEMLENIQIMMQAIS
ncbi:hypothetical protein [Brotaphodocola sp.]|uniref:hypothetical protein n=1 Tax=Brotaphodocola sp. TaxID=3073577 RepID=UPI003D7D286F